MMMRLQRVRSLGRPPFSPALLQQQQQQSIFRPQKRFLRYSAVRPTQCSPFHRFSTSGKDSKMADEVQKVRSISPSSFSTHGFSHPSNHSCIRLSIPCRRRPRSQMLRRRRSS